MQMNSMLEVDGWRKSIAVAPLKDVRSRLVEKASPLKVMMPVELASELSKVQSTILIACSVTCRKSALP